MYPPNCVVACRPTTAPLRAENHFRHTLTELIRHPSDIWSTVRVPRHGRGHAYGFWHRFKLPKSTHVDVQQDVFVGGRGSDRSNVCFKRLRAMSVAACAWCGKVESKLRCKQQHPKWRRVGDLVRLGVGGSRHQPAGCAEAIGRWCIADNWRA